MAELRLVKLLLPLQLLHDTVWVCMCAWGQYGPCVRMLWLPCPCWCTGWFCFWSMVPGIGGRGVLEVSWKGGKRGDGGGLNLPLVLMKTNELTRHDGIAFAKRGAECCIVISCRGRPKEQVDLLFQQEIATVLPPLPPYLFTETLRSLITAPSLLHSLLHVLIRRVIPHIIHPCWQRTTVYVRHRLGRWGLVPKMSQPCWFCISLPPYGQENREEIYTLGRVMKPGNWRSKEELKGKKKNKEWMKSRRGGKWGD